MEQNYLFMSNEILKIKELNSIETIENLDRMSLTHLKWMLEEIKKNEMSETKSSRWLGYVISIITLKGIKLPNYLTTYDLSKKKQSDITSHSVVAKTYLDRKTIKNLNKKQENIIELYECNNKLNIIIENQSSAVELNRMLGFIQGVFVYLELIKVDEERNKTRNYFNGE